VWTTRRGRAGCRQAAVHWEGPSFACLPRVERPFECRCPQRCLEWPRSCPGRCCSHHPWVPARRDTADTPAQGRRRAERRGGGRCAPGLPRAERAVPPLRRQGPQNIFALRVRSAEDLLLVPLPAEPLRHRGAAASARPRTRLADATPEGAHAHEQRHRPHRPHERDRRRQRRGLHGPLLPRVRRRGRGRRPAALPGARGASGLPARERPDRAVPGDDRGRYRPAEPVEHQMDA
jgi:hypothetical protein